MITAFAHDGALYDDTVINTHGFYLENPRDTKMVSIYNPLTGEKTDKTELVYNFVGFVSNEDDDLLIVFPKHYKVTNIESDSYLVFNCIANHMQKRPEMYIGEESNEKYKSNFPFAAFFNIYNYYLTYGLYFEDRTFFKPNTGGRLSWKATINRCNKYLINGNISLYPLYYRRNYYFDNFITECMIFAIDYTISKFGMFINAEPTGESFPEIDLLEEREYVISTLQQLRQQTFKDNEQYLIDSLINYFSEVNVGGNYYFKHYNFSSIWEDMIEVYLHDFYKEINGRHEIVFDKVSPSHLQFKKKSFHTNLSKPIQYISPDHYCEDNNIQLIFDAKYYTNIKGMNYKQIAYVFMLKEIRDSLNDFPKFTKTYSALILPSEKRKTKIHFQMNPLFSMSNSDVIITEEYIDIREVIKNYVK